MVDVCVRVWGGGRGNIVPGYGCVGGQDENSECMCAEY